MPVVYFREVSEDGVDARAEDDGRARLEYERLFIAKTDRIEPPTVILAYPRTPKKYQQYPWDPRAYAMSVVPTRRDTPLVWDITASYSNRIDPSQEQDEDPLARKPKITWKSQRRKRIKTHDIFGDPIVNTANDPYVPPIEDDGGSWVISIERNVARVPRWLLNYDESPINDDVITIQNIRFPRFSLRLFDLTISDLKFENGIPYYTVTWSLHHSKDGYKNLIPNRGFNERFDSDGDGVLDDKRKILIDGEPPSTPQWLDEDGKHLKDPEKADLIFNEVHTAERLPFRRLLN